MTFEQGPIRPPSEAESLFIRVTRNCPWNKCLFCHVYKKQKYSRRTVEEIKEDIIAMHEASLKVKAYALKAGDGVNITRDTLEYVYRREPELLQIALWLYKGGKNVFLQDADNLTMPAEKLAEVLSFIKEKFPTVERITTYTRSKTVSRRSVEELKMLREAGLSRVHIGLESGYDPLLAYMCKGVSAAEHIEAGLKAKEAGLSLSEYVMLGLGGRALWREHALETARVLSIIDPHFIRIRTLTIRQGIPLLEKVQTGEFQPLKDDEIVREERLLLDNLDGTGYYISDHILNLLEEVEGDLSHDKAAMIGVIDRYLDMPPEERANFRVGRRVGIYRYLDDMHDARRYSQVESLRKRLQQEGWDEDEFLDDFRGRYL
ncbi:MAG TPA: radical SAM protein [Firmicutes bacterium]|jgi:biotin synthase-like enzyme|nr:radical SAM protein [Bacillota bacterium]HAA34250.1 radical SAM protein [Bacillota bacterium]